MAPLKGSGPSSADIPTELRGPMAREGRTYVWGRRGGEDLEFPGARTGGQGEVRDSVTCRFPCCKYCPDLQSPLLSDCGREKLFNQM